MSWSACGTATVDEEHIVTLDVKESPQTSHALEESTCMIEQAKTVAKSILGSGLLGVGEFNVRLSGHCNPDHKPVVGWSNDCLQIGIDQLTGK